MRRSFRTRDAEHYGLPIYFEPYVHADGVSCVHCGALLTRESWERHQIDEHYDECVRSWMRGFPMLKADPRWPDWRAIAKYTFSRKSFGQGKDREAG